MLSLLMLTLAMTISHLVNGQSTTTNDDQSSKEQQGNIDQQSQFIGQLSRQLTLIARKLDILPQSVVNETVRAGYNSRAGWIKKNNQSTKTVEC
jgi:hypothetical protein